MNYAVLRLEGVRMAVVLVDRWKLQDELIVQLQTRLAMPVMLVSRDDAAWNGVRAKAQFDSAPYLCALLRAGEIEWAELPAEAEAELPF
jgi:hypothetical protein